MLNKVFTQKLFRTDKEVVVDFQSVTTVDEFWRFTEIVLLDGLDTNDDKDKSFEIPEGTSRIMNENILLGNLRLRQLRVRNDSCSSPDIFLHLFKDCYDFYSSSSEDQRSFGLKTGTAWNFHPAELLGGFPTWTSFQMYSGGGYFQDLTDSLEKNRLILKNLHENGWLNRGTRVLFIEFTIYNPNINVLCVSKLIVEVLPTGGLITSTDFRPSGLLGYTTASDLFLVVFEVLLAIQVLIYSVHEIIQMKKMGWNYFNFWNFIDLIILFVSYFALSLSIYCNIEKNTKVDAFNENPKKFVNFDSVSFWQLIFFDSLGILTFFVWIRILKFVDFSKTMVQFGKTLKKCVKDVAGFGLMFIIVFVAYAQLGFIFF